MAGQSGRVYSGTGVRVQRACTGAHAQRACTGRHRLGRLVPGSGSAVSDCLEATPWEQPRSAVRSKQVPIADISMSSFYFSCFIFIFIFFIFLIFSFFVSVALGCDKKNTDMTIISPREYLLLTD